VVVHAHILRAVVVAVVTQRLWWGESEGWECGGCGGPGCSGMGGNIELLKCAERSHMQQHGAD